MTAAPSAASALTENANSGSTVSRAASLDAGVLSRLARRNEASSGTTTPWAPRAVRTAVGVGFSPANGSKLDDGTMLAHGSRPSDDAGEAVFGDWLALAAT